MIALLARPFRALGRGLRLGLTSTDWLIRAIVIACIGLLALAAITLYYSAQGRAGIEAQRRSDEIAACRSEYRAPVDSAIDRLEAARVRRDDGLITGLVASVTNDRQALDRLVGDATEIREQTTDALKAKERATATYAKAVALSRTDPDAFLRACRRRTG